MESKRIGKLLVEDGYVTSAQVQEALKIQETKHGRIWNILMDLGYLSEEGFLEFLASMPGTASIELQRYHVEREILDLIPRELALDLEVVPIGKMRETITVAMVCPLDEQGRIRLEEATGMRAKPVLCSRSAVHKALDEYYRGQEKVKLVSEKQADVFIGEAFLKLHNVAELVETIENLPTLPDILGVISSIVDDPESTADDLATVISSDSALSSRLLKLANSAAFGFSRRVSSIKHAIALLGFRQTQALALSACVFDKLGSDVKFDLRAHWNHSFACATLAKLIGSAVKTEWNETAFLAGLFHDMGKLAIAMNMRGEQERIEAICLSDNMAAIEAEEAVLGINHAETGYLLADHWLLPPAMANAIRFHHSPGQEPEPKGLADVVFLADAYCKDDAPQQGKGTPFDDKLQEALEILGLGEGSFLNIVNAYGNLASEIKVF